MRKEAAMTTIRVFGMLLMLAGIFGMVWGALDYVNHRQTLDLGDRTLILQDKGLPPEALGGLALFIAGVLLTVATDENRRVRHA
jgi:uncharacterized membrane protein YdcZ (DUF606 family)